MIFRLSHKLATKLKVAPATVLPLDANPFADWSAYLFTAERTQFVILSNTTSLYSCVMYGRGITSALFSGRAMSCIQEFLAGDGQEFLYTRFIAPAIASVFFSKALNRSVTGSMNDLIFHARAWLVDGYSPHETAFKLNDIPLSSLDYRKPREVFKAQHSAEPRT